MVDNNDNNNQDITKIIQNIQENSLKKDKIILGSTIFSNALSFLSLALISWKVYKEKKSSPNARLIRKEVELLAFF